MPISNSSHSDIPDLSEDSFKEMREFAINRVEGNVDSFRDRFPSSDTGPSLQYRDWPVEDWTPSFWTGMCWLTYELTDKEIYREVSEGHLDQFEDRVAGHLEVTEDFDGHVQGTLTHDLGFLYTLSAVTQHQLTGDDRARQIALRAADHLSDRYHDGPGIIQAWGDHRDPSDDHYGDTIIDCMMNLPLLFWAAEEAGYDRYREIAETHAEQTAKHLIRENFSVCHVFKFDVETGEPIGHRDDQGADYGPGSCWARGQAWAIYGYAMAYEYTGRDAFLQIGRDLADHYLENVSEDLVPRWDFSAPEDHMHDTSAGAIAACGLMELATHLPVADADRERFNSTAVGTLASLGEHYTTLGRDSNALLTESWYTSVVDEVDTPDNATIWGDYFYLEGLARVTTDWTPYW